MRPVISVSIGRFAPTPSGPLHFGSVVAALGSFLDVRAAGGKWCVRIDDLDTPRVIPGAAATILATLEALGLAWDGPVVYQSQRAPAYAEALARLGARVRVFKCRCSRRELGEVPHPNTCREPMLGGTAALRVDVGSEVIEFVDVLQGRYRENLAETCGAFVVERADGIASYHLAVVVDDSSIGVDRIVRGADLLDSTARQIYLQRALGLPQPTYVHLPVVLDGSGAKLSKQTLAPAVTATNAATALFGAMEFLGLAPPAEARGEGVGALLDWAVARWSFGVVDRRARPYSWVAEN